MPETIECQFPDNSKFLGHYQDGYAIGELIEATN